LNTKKCLITIVSAIFIAAVTQAQEASEGLTAEKQLAQRKAELDARERALNEREKMLAEKERATASSTSRSREKAKAKAKHQQTIAQSQEEQAKAARAEKKLHEPFAQRLGEAFLEQLGTAAYTPPEPGATPTPRRIPPAPFDSPPFPSADWQIGVPSSGIRVSSRRTL
jgi:multidrug efflux pump subunit AcrA (membrane-fusion protein)